MKNKSRTGYSILNTSVASASRIITIFLGYVARIVFTRTLDQHYVGVSGLFLDFFKLLSLSELGISIAITYALYQPIADSDHEKQKSVMHLYRRFYNGVALIVLLIGLLVFPFLNSLIKGQPNVDHLQLIYLLYLSNSVISFLFVYKKTLIDAHQQMYISMGYYGLFMTLQYALQIVLLVCTHNFILYLLVHPICTLLHNIAISRKAEKMFPYLKEKEIQPLSREDKQGIAKNIKAMFMHKVGMLMETTTGSVVISAFIGVSMLGKYSNYALIMTSMLSVIKLAFTSLTSIWGHLYAEKSKDTVRSYCEAGHLLNFWIGTLFFLGYYAIVDNLVAILFSEDLMISRSISFVIALNGFVQYIRENTLVFREATGTFYNDRWKSLFEALMNVILSVIFVKRFEVAGVVVATMLTNLLICHVVEPYVLYKHAFASSPRRYYWKNYGMILLFGASLLLLDKCLLSYTSQWKELLVNGCISVAIAAAVSVSVIPFHKEEFRNTINEHATHFVQSFEDFHFVAKTSEVTCASET